MDGFDPAKSFGPEVAQRYDGHSLRGDEAETVEFLASHAGNGSALEFALGPGRIAIPLSERGIHVDGIELSPDMVAQLRKKPGGDKVDVTVGDMARVSAPRGDYGLVYLVFNTIYNILTQELMARIAGLRLVDRWGGWNAQPFTASSSRHISVYARAVE
jgi:hypothetical protein